MVVRAPPVSLKFDNQSEKIRISLKCRICLQCRRPRFHFWVEKIPWRREWQPTPVFLPGKSYGEMSLEGHRPWDRRVEHDWAANTYTQKGIAECAWTFNYPAHHKRWYPGPELIVWQRLAFKSLDSSVRTSPAERGCPKWKPPTILEGSKISQGFPKEATECDWQMAARISAATFPPICGPRLWPWVDR